MPKLVVFLALTFLVASLVSAVPEGEFSFDNALERLADDEFKERMAAQGELREWSRQRAEQGIRVFYGLYRTHEDPEVRLRCRELLKELVVSTILSKQGEGYIGVRMMDQALALPGKPVRNAVRITEVMPGTPAQRAKLQAGDLVTGIDDLEFGQRIATEAFGDYVRNKKPEETVTLHLLREGKPMDQKVGLMKRPPEADRLFFQLGEQYVPPDQAAVEEREFREWLKKQAEEDKAGAATKPAVPRN